MHHLVVKSRSCPTCITYHAVQLLQLTCTLSHMLTARAESSRLQVGLLAAFGGGILSSLLLQDPKRAPIALLASNSVGVIWTACWWLVNYLPGGLVARLLRLRPFKLVAKARPSRGFTAGVLLTGRGKPCRAAVQLAVSRSSSHSLCAQAGCHIRLAASKFTLVV